MEEKIKNQKNVKNVNGLSSFARGVAYIFLFALGLSLSGYLSLVFFQWYLEGGTVTLPDFRNQNLIEVINNSARLGLQVEVKKLEYDPQSPLNLVLSQDPQPGSKVKKGSRVWVVVNGGGTAVAQGGVSSSGVSVVPDLREKKLEEVETILRESGLQLGRVVEATHDRIPRGYVISQNPPPQSKVSQGEKVNLLVSKGSEILGEQAVVKVPDLVGLRFEEAKILLAQEGLSVGTVEEVPAGERRAGIIVDQNPLPGEEVEAGQSINLWVSKRAQESTSSQIASGTKELSLRFVLPDSRVPIEVKVVASDELGERVLYEKTHQGGELVEFSAPTKGKGKVVIFLNGYYYWEKALE
ncbi:MAG: PASTA domain-containing protein [Candidatus Atribacteria bacterium]|nr:PASTA domain-containing protein [Candidatus Atribacteria bacterium]